MLLKSCLTALFVILGFVILFTVPLRIVYAQNGNSTQFTPNVIQSDLPGVNPDSDPRYIAERTVKPKLKLDVKPKTKPKFKPKIKKLLPRITQTPTLEVRQLGGEFEKWGDSMTINYPQKLLFRWGNARSNATSAQWQVSLKPFPHGSAPLEYPLLKRGSLSKVPQKGKVNWFRIDFAKFLSKRPPSTPKFYFVRLVQLGANKKPVGVPSLPVTIVYRKPAPAGTIYLDSAHIISLSQSSGIIYGPPSGVSGGSMNNKNSLVISYSYDLNTEDTADIRQWLLLESGSVAKNNFWTYAPIKKGVGSATTRATITCKENGPKTTQIKAIKIKITHGGNVLFQGTKPLPAGIYFRCP